MSRRLPRGAGGSASLLAVTLLALLVLVGSALGVVTAMVVAHRKAQAAADLAGLAAAAALQRAGDACLAAAEIAEANGASLATCVVDGEEVTVETRVAGPRWLGQEGDLTGRARAGPVRG